MCFNRIWDFITISKYFYILNNVITLFTNKKYLTVGLGIKITTKTLTKIIN